MRYLKIFQLNHISLAVKCAIYKTYCNFLPRPVARVDVAIGIPTLISPTASTNVAVIDIIVKSRRRRGAKLASCHDTP